MNNLFKKPIFWIIFLGAIAIIGAILTIGKDSPAVEEDVALRVNNAVFSYGDFNVIAGQIAQELQMYGMQPTKEEIKNEAVNRIIQQVLLEGYAGERGIEATEEEIDRHLSELAILYGMESEEEFINQLKSQGFETAEEVRNLLRTEIKISKLIDLYSEDVNVTDQELRDAYQDYVGQIEETDQEIMPFEEEKEGLKDGIIQERVMSMLLSKIEELKKGAKIEIFIKEDDLEVDIIIMDGAE